ncbi:MAG: hypothetical protein MI700_09265 [Balneolales bacterium]|nr:hypothetical protein [Balneolales bacterium]
MAELPFNIPKSLSSFVEIFETDQEKAIEKLSRQVRKRDPDAVGHFLLAWFYHLSNNNQQAIREALKAKTYAPGSPLMEHLHYFLVHPELFDAKVPAGEYGTEKKFQQAKRTSPILDLDRLIEMLEAVESQRIQMPTLDENIKEEDLSEASSDIEDIVSETLAKIHVNQGNKKEAIKMYERLIVTDEKRAGEYTKKISKLKDD